MKRCKIEITVIIPDRTPVADAVEEIENTDKIGGYDVDAVEVVWQDEDEPDDDELAAAYEERRGYEADITAAMRL